jgi:hypothetical protein
MKSLVQCGVKNQLILKAIRDAGYKNVGDFVKAGDVSAAGVYYLIAFKCHPINKLGEFTPAANFLMTELCLNPLDLWEDEYLADFESRENSKGPDNAAFLFSAWADHEACMVLPDPMVELERKQAAKALDEAISTLTDREIKVMKMHYMEDISFDEIAKDLVNLNEGSLGITPFSSRLIEAKALRKLRHPMRSDEIREACFDEGADMIYFNSHVENRADFKWALLKFKSGLPLSLKEHSLINHLRIYLDSPEGDMDAEGFFSNDYLDVKLRVFRGVPPEKTEDMHMDENLNFLADKYGCCKGIRLPSEYYTGMLDIKTGKRIYRRA